jgi:cytochrome c biogenesis protein CcmG, thiol:disulfide interchange protein DsbE
VLGALALAAMAVTLATSGGGGEPPAGASAGIPPRATEGLPPALARNLEADDRLVAEGQEGLAERLGALEGHPVVINQWASWCTSCRAKFPFFREAVERHGDRVAFLGLDSQDERRAAERFLEEFPVGFPSIFDPDASVAASLGGGQSWPTTIFLDEEGGPLHVKIGAYASAELLEQDIRRYALAAG